MGEIQSFGKWLRHRRRELDLTQDVLARQVGCATITIRKIEADEMRPSKQLAEALVKQLELPAEEMGNYLRFARGEALTAPVATAASQNNLPHFVSSFIGREREISEIRHLISTSRLVTLTGAGGCGKTRLAIEVARGSLNQFSDGAWLVDFVPLREPSLILQTIASSLGIREEIGRSLIQTLGDYFRTRNLLLIFDNCEHLVATSAEVAGQLLQVSSYLHILATSRETLGILGEAQYRVPSLSLPDSQQIVSLESLAQSEATRLFIERAEILQPTSTLKAASPATIVQICERLDGIPLAIELAAARVKTLTVEHIAQRLDDRFNLLTIGNRGAIPRHQTLRATLDWSYELLSEEQRTLFRRLAVFRGGWTLEAAEAVCADERGPVGKSEVLEICSRLVDQSLLVVDYRADGERYNLLETIREYAREKLMESGEEEEIRRRHLDFYSGLAEQAERKYRGGEQKIWLHRMENERDNFRSSIYHALQTKQIRAAERLIGLAFWLWFFRGPWNEGQKWVETVLAWSSGNRTVLEARNFMALGLLNFAQSDYLKAESVLNESLVIWRELDDRWWCAFVLNFLALITRVHDRDAASALFRESLETARATEDQWLTALSLWNSGENELNNKYLDEAQRQLEESLRLCNAVGDGLVKHEVLRTLGELAEVKGDYPQAVKLYEESLRIIKELDAPSISMLHLNLGRVLQLSGDNNEAAKHFTEEIKWTRQIGDQASLLRALQGLGVVAAAQGKAHRAVRLFVATEVLFAGLGYNFSFNPNETTWLERHLGRARAELGEDEFSTAKAEGQAMSLDQAVEYALEEI